MCLRSGLIGIRLFSHVFILRPSSLLDNTLHTPAQQGLPPTSLYSFCTQIYYRGPVTNCQLVQGVQVHWRKSSSQTAGPGCRTPRTRSADTSTHGEKRRVSVWQARQSAACCLNIPCWSGWSRCRLWGATLVNWFKYLLVCCRGSKCSCLNRAFNWNIYIYF